METGGDDEDVDFVLGADVPEPEDEIPRPGRRGLPPGAWLWRGVGLVAVVAVAGGLAWSVTSGRSSSPTPHASTTIVASGNVVLPAPVIPAFTGAATVIPRSPQPTRLIVRFPADQPTATVTFDPQLPVLRTPTLCPTSTSPPCRTVRQVPTPAWAAIRAVFPAARRLAATTVTRGDLAVGSLLVSRQVVAASGDQKILVQIARHNNANAGLLIGTTSDGRVTSVGNSIGGFDLRVSVQAPPGHRPSLSLASLVRLSRDNRLLTLP